MRNSMCCKKLVTKALGIYSSIEIKVENFYSCIYFEKCFSYIIKLPNLFFNFYYFLDLDIMDSFIFPWWGTEAGQSGIILFMNGGWGLFPGGWG